MLSEALNLPAGSYEREQLERARAGDDLVWGRWYDEYYPFLYRYALNRLHDREEAEDIAAQVFLEAFKSIDRYEPRDRPLLAWLYGICRNLAANRMRRQRREQLARSRAQQEVESETASDGLVESVDLERALAELTPEQREVLTLRFRLGLPTREVAVLVGKGEGAVYSLQVRGIASLRRHLAS